METYLKKIGVQVHKVTEVEPGDIVGESKVSEGCTYEEITLYYVQQVVPNPCYIKWLGPESPYVIFKLPNIGFSVEDDKEGRIHIYTNPRGSKCKWSEIPLAEAIKQGFGNDNEEWKEFGYDIRDECFDLYKITDAAYVKLGKLIPDVEVPCWSALAQTIKGHEPIIDFVKRTKGYFQQARELYAKIEQEVKRTDAY